MKKNGIPASLYNPLKEIDIQRIANAAFNILEKSGVGVYSPTGFDAFKKAGAKVDQNTRVVRLTRSMIEDTIDSNPSSITLFSRNGNFNVVLENNRVHYGTGGTAIYVLDPDNGEHRPSTIEDVVLNARIVDVLENIHVFTNLSRVASYLLNKIFNSRVDI